MAENPEARATLDGVVCAVSGTLDFNTAPGCLKTVAGFIDQQSTLTIDLTGVERSNSAGLALMIEWLAIARQKNHTLSFRAVPDGLRQLAGVCQVDGMI